VKDITKQLQTRLARVQRGLATADATDALLLKRAVQLEQKLRADLAQVAAGLRTAKDAYQEQGLSRLYQDMLGDLNRVLSVQKVVRHRRLLRRGQKQRPLVPGETSRGSARKARGSLRAG